MTANELRKKYLEFFKEKGHAIIPSAPLIPENDPTVLFTTAGMHPLVPYLLGQKHPLGRRLADVQKCIRTGDIDDVGDAWHLTFFEMLGNWSLGDYWKKEAIEWSFEFLTNQNYLGIPSEKLSITVFVGDQDAPADEESVRIWQSLGIPKERIFYLSKDDNWWGPAGQTGPCGPCTEIFYDTGQELCGHNCYPGCRCGKYAEIWNDVFMEFNKTAEGRFEQLSQKNVDTGMGVERTIAVLGGFDNVYDTGLYVPMIRKIEELAGKKYNAPHPSPLLNRGEGEIIRAMRIVADHSKAATFILAEGLEPSNVERGYVLRRLIRRAVRYGKQLGINEVFTFKIAPVVIEMYRDIYPELHRSRAFIEEQLVREEERFGKTLERGLKQFESQKSKVKSQDISSKANIISGEMAFDLYQTFGFPVELTEELAKEEGLDVDIDGFNKALKKHQALSRAGAEQKFKGGLADHSEIATKYHTATHMLLAALREVLGEQVYQKGSNITVERLRFDFSYPQKMTLDELSRIEDLVNEKIKENLSVLMEEMDLVEAKNRGIRGVFEERYGDKVRVYIIGENDKIYSREICGGPHVERTGVLGRFKILKEEAVSAGVRRIKAVLSKIKN